MSPKVRTAIIGLGGMGSSHLRAAKKLNQFVDIVALVDSNQQRLNDAVNQLDRPAKTYTDTGLMFEEASPELTIIATPHAMHWEHVVKALLNGSHVLCEKPLVNHYHEFEAIAQLANSQNLSVATGFNKRFDWRVEEAFRTLQQAKLGQLQLVKITDAWHHTGLYQTMSAAQAKGYRDWRADQAIMGRGGIVNDTGAHALSLIVALANNQNIHLDYVYGDNTYLTMMDGPDTLHVLGHFDNGCRFEAFCSWAHTAASTGNDRDRWHYPLLEMWGTKGNLIAYGRQRGIGTDQYDEFQEAQLQEYPDKKSRLSSPGPYDPTVSQLFSVVKSLRDAGPLINDLSHAGKVVQLTEQVIDLLPQTLLARSAAD